MREIDPDARLMVAFGGGDMAAFDKLFERWKGPLLRYLDRIVHDAATAEELVQEAFLRVHRARDRYVADAKFSTWLYRIATNLAFNELRRPNRRYPHASTDAPEGPTLWLEKGGVELSLVKGLPREGVDWVAILVSMLDGKRFKVQSQSEVNVKGFAYKVIDIKQNQVLIKDMDTGEQLKVTRLTRTEALTLGRDPGQMAPLRGARGRGGGAPTSGRVLNPRMRR